MPMHTAITWLIFALLVFFVLAQVYVEAVNEGPDCRWWRESMSHYLGEVKHAGVQAMAFLGFAGAEALMIYAYPHSTAWTVCLSLAVAGLVGVTLTGVSNPEWKWHAQIERLHTICSGFAFGAALIGEAIYLWHTPSIWLVFGAAATAIGFARFAPSQGALEEKFFAAWIVAAFIAIAGVPL